MASLASTVAVPAGAFAYGPEVAIDQAQTDALPAVPDGTSETFTVIPAGCVDLLCQSVALVTVGWPRALSEAEATQADRAAPIVPAARTASFPTGVPSGGGEVPARYVLTARHRIPRPPGSLPGTAMAASATRHSKTASYKYCSAGIFGIAACGFWHATAKERFYYDGTKALATLPLNNPNTYVNCGDVGGQGYTVDATFCGFLGRNPAPYGNGSFLLGREDFTVSLIFRAGFQYHHYIEFHNYGDGYVGVHHG